MSAWLLLDERAVRAAVSNHDDGDRGQPDVHHQVLIVARFGANLCKHKNISENKSSAPYLK